MWWNQKGALYKNTSKLTNNKRSSSTINLFEMTCNWKFATSFVHTEEVRRPCMNLGFPTSMRWKAWNIYEEQSFQLKKIWIPKKIHMSRRPNTKWKTWWASCETRKGRQRKTTMWRQGNHKGAHGRKMKKLTNKEISS
jgi:hypothetical protein